MIAQLVSPNYFWLLGLFIVLKMMGEHR